MHRCHRTTLQWRYRDYRVATESNCPCVKSFMKLISFFHDRNRPLSFCYFLSRLNPLDVRNFWRRSELTFQIFVLLRAKYTFIFYSYRKRIIRLDLQKNLSLSFPFILPSINWVDQTYVYLLCNMKSSLFLFILVTSKWIIMIFKIIKE